MAPASKTIFAKDFEASIIRISIIHRAQSSGGRFWCVSRMFELCMLKSHEAMVEESRNMKKMAFIALLDHLQVGSLKRMQCAHIQRVFLYLGSMFEILRALAGLNLINFEWFTLLNTPRKKRCQQQQLSEEWT